MKILSFGLALLCIGAYASTCTLDPEPLIDLNPAPFLLSTKMEVGPDGKIYFNTNLGIILRTDNASNLELVGVVGNYPAPQEDPLAAFTPGITFDEDGNVYVVNSAGVYTINASELANGAVPLAGGAADIYTVLGNPASGVVRASLLVANAGYAFGLGITSDRNGNLYVVDILLGNIFKVSIANPSLQLWASGNIPKYCPIQSVDVRTSVNPLGSGFGLTDITIDPSGDWLYFGTQEGRGTDCEKSTTGVYKIRIKEDGQAGGLDKLADYGIYAMNGISFDVAQDRIVTSAPWFNFSNGVTGGPNFEFSDRGTDDVQTAGGVWYLTRNDDVWTSHEVIIDESVGTVVDAVSGSAVGSGYPNKFYVSDGGFDALPVWTFPDPMGTTIYPGKAPHAAIRSITCV